MVELSPLLKQAKYFFDINTMNTVPRHIQGVLFMYRSVKNIGLKLHVQFATLKGFTMFFHIFHSVWLSGGLGLMGPDVQLNKATTDSTTLQILYRNTETSTHTKHTVASSCHH